MERYFKICNVRLIKGFSEIEGSSMIQKAFEFQQGEWNEIDVNTVNDRLIGYDSYEGIGCTSVMNQIEEISLDEANKFLAALKGFEFVKREYKKNREKYYPLIGNVYNIIYMDDYEDGEKNIGWYVGIIEDNRPFLAETWESGDGYRRITIYMATEGIEDKTNAELICMFKDYGYFTVKEGAPKPHIGKIADEGVVYYSITVDVKIPDDDTVWFEGGVYLPYSILNEYNKKRMKLIERIEKSETKQDICSNNSILFLMEYRKNPGKYLPLIDHAYRKTSSRNEFDDCNIGWNAGVIGNNRPYFAEAWATEGITLLTVFISTEGIEDKSVDELLQMLDDAGYCKQKVGAPSPEVQKFVDYNGNEFYSINIIVGLPDEDETWLEGGRVYGYKVLNNYIKSLKDDEYLEKIRDRKVTHKELDSFDENWSLAVYRELVKYSLMHEMSWQEFHTEEGAEKRISECESWIKEYYEEQASPNDAAVDIGYSCG